MKNHLKANLKQRASFIRICAMSLVLTACGSGDDAADRQALYQSYSIEDIQSLFEEGEIQQALDALQFFRENGTASDEHLKLLIKIYVAVGDGIAAETMATRLQSRGGSENETVLFFAQAAMVQEQFEKAEKILAEADIPEDQIFDALLLRGDAARSLRDIPRAKEFYEAAVAADPNNFRGHTAVALLAIEQADLEQARKYAKAAAALVENDSIVSYVQGMIARYSNELGEAKTYFLRAIELNDTNLLARIEIIAVLLLQNDIEAAQEQLDIIYARSPNNAMANYYTAMLLVSDGKFGEAQDLMLRSEDFTRSYPPAAQIYGLTNYELKRYATAVEYLSIAVRYYPNDLDIRLALADSLIQRGQSNQALQILQPVTDGTLKNVDGLAYAAAAASSQGDVRAARAYLERAVAMAENSDQVAEKEAQNDLKNLKRRLASARYLDGDLAGATNLLDTIHTQGSADIDSLTLKANMLLSANDFAAAANVVRDITAVDPNSAVADNLAGVAYHKQGRYDDAIAAYSTAIAKVPAYQSALKNRALTYVTVRDFKNARNDLDAVIKLAPNDMQIAAMYGRTLLETNDAKLALPYLKAASDAFPNTAIIAADYAEALAELGYYASALTIARKARTLASHNADFIAYMNEKSEEWQQAKLDDEAKAAAVAKDQNAETEAQRAKEKELQAALKAEASLPAGAEDEVDASAKALAELRKIAEENRKADEKEKLAEEARRAVDAKAAAEADARAATKAAPSNADEAVARAAKEKEAVARDERNKRFGFWLAQQLDLPDAHTEAYVLTVLNADKSEEGDTDVVRKALSDLEKSGKFMTIQSIEKKLAEFADTVAAEQKDSK